MASHEQGETPQKSISLIPPEILLSAYMRGIFPMAHEGKIHWFSPDPRGILPIEGFHIPRGLRVALRDPQWEIRVDTCFEEVMRACAERRETWIDERILGSYLNLHRLGFAHSVETWREGQLVGGLYGISLGSAFFGESMFHCVSNASKVALHALIQILRTGGYHLLDTQWTTAHLKQFGGREIPRDFYLDLLEEAMGESACFDGKVSKPPFETFDDRQALIWLG